MKIVELIRLEEDFDHGTFGVLKIDKKIFCATLEPADLENAKNISSIPAQQYLCRRHVSLKFGETFLIENVPGRDGILFHKGNTIEDTAGCILLGESWKRLGEFRAVINSHPTFKRFMNTMKDEDVFHLTIREVY